MGRDTRKTTKPQEFSRKTKKNGESESENNSNDNTNEVKTKSDENDVVRSIQSCKVFVPEKIIIALDATTDAELTNFQDTKGNQFISLAVLKEAVEHFVQLKTLSDRNHEFALIVLEESKAKLVCNLTNKSKDFIKCLRTVNECENEDIFDANSVFREMFKITDELHLENNPEMPTNVARLILIYNRSFTKPKIDLNDKMKGLLKSPHFTLDVLVLHEPVDAGNNCENIFETLQSLETRGSSYFFTVERDLRALKTSFGKLLAHPSQRPLQNNWNCSI